MLKSKVNLYEVYDNWRKDLRYFECYFKTTPIASLKQCEDFELEEVYPSNEIKNSVLALKDKLSYKKTIYIFDLPLLESIETALILNNDLGIKPVLVFNHISHDFGIVGSKIFISKLIQYSYELKELKDSTYAFMLDKDRYLETEFDKRIYYNNQYELTEEELPPVEILNDLGINRVVVISVDKLKEDLTDYVEYLKKENIFVEIINEPIGSKE
ncbi:hypothetical protein SAMN02745163_03413 [Clostridium cavendishii DSM 21758]|uniref:Uncharacterized protein n=1 Tax=Clostridium cavendishii DSM 21758 TaxID=1121302 RepID=A0A1M6QIU6_9CLOT|nr:hypothetical protein [Clostridium cavendishii]SHK19983.1 hypothetical protein SAMN02745163_03413 [Clostridium cavendishii DSM 21758]